MEEAFQKYCSISAAQALQEDRFDILLVENIEPYLGLERPTFLYDYPLQLASLARAKAAQPEVAERFELYMAGIELANGFSELTDSVQQRARFEDEYAQMGVVDKGQRRIPEFFLQDLEKIDTAAGIAMGLDRLFMLLSGQDTLNTAVTFSPDELDM